MGQPAELPAPRRATYADVLAAPRDRVAEVIGGVLYTFPRPAPRHTFSASRLGARLSSSFDLGDPGPDGWWILDEPELHLPDPTVPECIDIVAPDLAGWRRVRMPTLPEEAYFTTVPDWVCEVLSVSTAGTDRVGKMQSYAREGVLHAWLIDPIACTLEVYRLTEERRWLQLSAYQGTVKVQAEPFEAIELDLAALWVPKAP